MTYEEMARWVEQRKGYAEFHHAPVAIGGHLQEVKLCFNVDFSGRTFLEVFEKAHQFFQKAENNDPT